MSTPLVASGGGFDDGGNSVIPVQKYMGATVSKFYCSTDYGSQPGSCDIILIQDDTDGDLFTPGVIGSPQFFKIVDSNGATIFEYSGILDIVTRTSSPDNKTYKVTLVSPLKVLEAVTIIIDGYTGYGTTLEGLPQLYSEDGYYQISQANKQNGYLPDGVTMTPSVDYFEETNFSFATNNANLSYTGMWNRVFNLLNVYAAYENEWVDSTNSPIAVTAYSGYGSSSSVKGSMRVDKIAYAIDQLVNRTHSSSPRRYIGGNIVYGTNTYNVCATAGGYVPPMPYYYGLDIIGFMQYALNYLPEDFVITGPSITLADFISTICDAINADFIVELNYGPTYQLGLFQAQMSQTYPLTTFGGIISITLIPRNTYVNCSRPFSNFTYDLLNLERPDMGDYQYSGNVNPGTFIPSAGFGANNPLDQDYAYRGTEGSYPYGGKFPVETPADSRGTAYNPAYRAEQIDLSLRATPGTVAKMVVGGYQSRMNVVPRDFIYQYWGEITFVSKPIDACGINRTSQKSLPVITQILPPNDTWDWIAIDMQDIFGDKTIGGILYKGIYFASVMEIRAAMDSYESWSRFLNIFKRGKRALLDLDLFKQIAETTQHKYHGTVSKYLSIITGKDGSAAPDKLTKSSITTATGSIRSAMHEKIANIGNTHYGKSWVAPIPVFKSKITSQEDNIVGNYERSWDVADSAYVEPYTFGTLGAPKDSRFMDSGRLKAFVNYEHSFPGDGGIGYNVMTQTLTGSIAGVNYKYDFSEYGKDVVFDFDPDNAGDETCPLLGLAYAEPQIDKKYIFVPEKYFEFYNRGNCPFMDSVDAIGNNLYGAYYVYVYEYLVQDITKDKVRFFRSLVNDPNKKSFFSGANVLAILNYDTSPAIKDTVYTPESNLFNTITSGIGNTVWQHTPLKADATNNYPTIEDFTEGNYDAFFSWNYTGTAMYDIINGMINNPANDKGQGLPFVRFETNRVYYPATISANGFDPLSAEYMDALEKAIKNKFKDEAGDPIEGLPTLDTSSFGSKKNKFFPPVVAPRAIGIPQQSNRYVYGPWITNFTNIIYGGKVEYEKNEELVPENFMIPVYGSTPVNWNIVNKDGETVRILDSINGTVLSGIAGMNLAGQAIANSIDNFSLFAQEEGSMTIDGLPIISKVGGILLNGPRVTDINVNFDGGQVKTTYNFRSLSPRYGKSDRELLKKLRKLSSFMRNK